MESTTSSSAPLHAVPFHLLEISLISAQDLAPVYRSMSTYAVAWLHPNRKLTTRIDHKGHTNPTWNEKFSFRITDEFLYSDESTITVHIYTVAWFRDVLVGSVTVLVNDLVLSSAQTQTNSSVRFVALQIRRPNGTPQGILNMGVSFIDSTIRSMPLCNNEIEGSIMGFGDNNNKVVRKLIDPNKVADEDTEKQQLVHKIELWRSRSAGTELTNEDFARKQGSVANGGSMINGGSVCNGSMLNGSELCSDVGPSASIVAAEIASRNRSMMAPRQTNIYRPAVGADEGTGGSVLGELTAEEAAARGWRRDLPPKHDRGRHARSRSDGGGFRCFAYGLEFTIVCGSANPNPNNNNNNKIIATNSKKKSNRKKSQDGGENKSV